MQTTVVKVQQSLWSRRFSVRGARGAELPGRGATEGRGSTHPSLSDFMEINHRNEAISKEIPWDGQGPPFPSALSRVHLLGRNILLKHLKQMLTGPRFKSNLKGKKTAKRTVHRCSKALLKGRTLVRGWQKWNKNPLWSKRQEKTHGRRFSLPSSFWELPDTAQDRAGTRKCFRGWSWQSLQPPELSEWTPALLNMN